MPIGPGKYDDICTHALKESNAKMVAVIVMDGNKGSGFAVQAVHPAYIQELPDLLQIMVDEIRKLNGDD